MKCFTNNLNIKSIIPIIDNEHDFAFIRGHLLNKPTDTEHKIASRIATTSDPYFENTVDNPLF